MAKFDKARKINNVLHRDLGYFFAALIIAYSISGIALNHVDDWNPDFIITKKEIALDRRYDNNDITPDRIEAFSALAGENGFRLYDFPSERQVKIYYRNATMQIDLASGKGTYEKISRRPLFYEVNVLHRNSVDWWKWASDLFALMLIAITLTGMFMLRGSNGLKGRGKWLLAAGAVPPVLALLMHQL
ncbi:MAG: PepSY-associated TM helix domain-containing protein [Chlorobi bacterium]|nr:PepSY-associated TM helix domain-containing protein [Chlorobiota bacterium]